MHARRGAQELCDDAEAGKEKKSAARGYVSLGGVRNGVGIPTPVLWKSILLALVVVMLTATCLILASIMEHDRRETGRSALLVDPARTSGVPQNPGVSEGSGPPRPQQPPAFAAPGMAASASGQEGKMPSFRACDWPDTTNSSVQQEAGLVLLRGGVVHAPQYLGRRDVLLSGSSVLKLWDATDPAADHEINTLVQLQLVTVLDVTGSHIVPGFVDIHVHVTGGGGESGPESKVPECRLSELFQGGLTTVVGVLGTDSVSRTAAELLTKVNALNRTPLTAYMWTGAYKVLPEVPTVTGTVEKDVAFVGPIIGVKTAVSDHRSSQEGAEKLRNLVAQARVGGMLGGKAGLVYAHMGDGFTGLAPLFDVVNNTPIPISQMLPTHMGRTEQLVLEGTAWINRGGAVDVTANSGAAAVLEQYNASGADMSRVCVSSDAGGSLPKFNEQKQLVGYDYGRPDRLLKFLRNMVLQRNHPLSDVLALITENPARVLQLPKGQIREGGHADLMVLDHALTPTYVIAQGQPVLTPVCVAKDLFED